jgi:hypothetical protein
VVVDDVEEAEMARDQQQVERSSYSEALDRRIADVGGRPDRGLADQ